MPLVSINNKESLLVSISSRESLLVNSNDGESLLVTLHRAICPRSAHVPSTFRLRSAHVLFVAVAVAVRRGGGGGGGGRCRL